MRHLRGLVLFGAFGLLLAGCGGGDGKNEGELNEQSWFTRVFVMPWPWNLF